MSNYEINDVRTLNDFKSVSFSKFQKTKVKKELLNKLAENKVEPACYWSAELICSGHLIELWETIIYYISKNVHIGNPLLPTYILRRMESFKDIISQGYIGNELSLRNNITIRKLFAEVIATLCMSRKHHVFEAVKIRRKEDFNMTHISTRLKAPNISYSQSIFRENDPTELLIAINELAYHLSPESKNSYTACYWAEWILEYECVCKQSKEKIIIERRDWVSVNSKYQTDIIWIIWDAIIQRATLNKCQLTKRIIDSLLGIFTLRFTPGVRKRRRFLIYNAISLLTDSVDLTIPIWANKTAITNIVNKIDVVYSDIKKNEERPATDYLFSGVKRSNLDKTRERLEIMNKVILPS